MIEQAIDTFIFLFFISGLFLLCAIIGKSLIIGGFAGLLLVLTGTYGLATELSTLSGLLKFGLCLTVICFGVLVLYEVYVCWLEEKIEEE